MKPDPHKVLIKVNNTAEKLAALQLLSNLTGTAISDTVWQDTVEGKFISEYPYVYFDEERNVSATSDEVKRGYRNIDFANIGVLYAEPKIEVRLSDSYTAIVTAKGIKVGCQNISHSTLDMVHAASMKLRSGVYTG